MADIKISEMDELLPYNEYEGTGGVSSEDLLTILDISEEDLSKVNKKIRVSTLLEDYASLYSPRFKGIPSIPTPDINSGPSNDLVNIAWVLEKLELLKLGDLENVSSTSPADGQTLIYSTLENQWKPGSSNTVNRQSNLTANKTLTSTDATYQFLGSTNSSVDIILPTGSIGLKFVIKNITPNTTSLNIKEGTTTVAVIDLNTQVVECIHDSVEWHILLL